MAEQRNDSVVFIGRKPTMSYVMACLTLFQNGTNDITLKARGKAISKAVDAAQILTKKFIPGLTVSGVELGTEMVRSIDSGATSDVSSMEIHLSR